MIVTVAAKALPAAIVTSLPCPPPSIKIVQPRIRALITAAAAVSTSSIEATTPICPHEKFGERYAAIIPNASHRNPSPARPLRRWAMYFADGLTLDAPRRTSDGYVAVRAHAARTGAYQYSGRDVDPDNKHGLRDQAIVHVARDASDVFDAASLGSFVGKPITDDHPTASVNAANWRDHARGIVMGAVKDGERVGFDLAFLDAATIAKLDAGKAELSNGYNCDLQFGEFTASDGTKCQARQTNIRGNHVALVDRGRAGSECRVNMAACDALPSTILDSLKTEKTVKTMLIDGLTVDISNADTAEATINTLLAARDGFKADLGKANDTIAAKDRELATKDTEIADLKAKVSDEATLDARADAKAELVTKGKAILGDKMPDVKGKSLADTRRAIVAAAGINVTDKSDDYIEARFDGLKDAKASISGAPVNLGDATTATANARASWLAAKEAAYASNAA